MFFFFFFLPPFPSLLLSVGVALFSSPPTAVHRPESQNFTSGTVCAPSSAAK